MKRSTYGIALLAFLAGFFLGFGPAAWATWEAGKMTGAMMEQARQAAILEVRK